jgi:hypothetical protein
MQDSQLIGLARLIQRLLGCCRWPPISRKPADQRSLRDVDCIVEPMYTVERIKLVVGQAGR